jgi:hypothetical protein
LAPFWHRWSYFSIINLSVFHLADKCFAIANLINLRIILFLEYRKTPETQGFWGILRLDTECTPDTQFISSYNYSMIVATRPDPTVRPPSRIANVRPCSIATGWMSSIVISTLSPGMHISVPAGSSQTPVTSVVLK